MEAKSDCSIGMPSPLAFGALDGEHSMTCDERLNVGHAQPTNLSELCP
jgi:hypothetical protein